MTDRLNIILGDITTQNVDAIVNAANRALCGGGGVDGAIHRAAGKDLLAASRLLGPCDTGDAKLTLGFNLPAQYVIHAVGPVWQGGDRNEAVDLAACYRRAFELASEHQITTIAFPSISTGAYGFPLSKAAKIAVATVLAGLSNNPQVKHATFVCFDRKTLNAYLAAVKQLAPPA